MFDVFSEPVLVALAGLFGGALLGLAARIDRFCTLGAIEDLIYGDNSLRLLMWGVAIGVAAIGTFGLAAIDLLDLGGTLYLSRSWNPLESIFGALLFGYGMALAGNCGYGALARLGGGDLRALLIVLTMGIFAYVTLGGPLSSLHIWLFGGSERSTNAATFAHSISYASGFSIESVGIIFGKHHWRSRRCLSGQFDQRSFRMGGL